MTPDQLLAEVQAIPTDTLANAVPALTQFISDFTTYVNGIVPPSCPTVASAVITFSDGSTQSLPPAPPQVPQA